MEVISSTLAIHSRLIETAGYKGRPLSTQEAIEYIRSCRRSHNIVPARTRIAQRLANGQPTGDLQIELLLDLIKNVGVVTIMDNHLDQANESL